MTSTKLSPLDVMKALKPLNAINTRKLIFHLGVPDNDLDDIQVTYRDASSQKTHFVGKWLDFDPNASWEKLVFTLDEIGMHSLAVDIGHKNTLKAEAPLLPLNSTTAIGSLTTLCEEKIQVVRAEIENLKDQFFQLKSDTKASFCDKEEQDKRFLETFRDFLLDFPVAKRVIHVKFFLKNEDEILEAKNIRKLFAILGRYCNYLNYEIIVHIVKKFGNVNLKGRMLKYCDSMKKFEISTTVAVYLKAISANPDGEICKGFTRMAMKINKSTSDCTLHEIRQLKEAIAENASVHSYSVYIESMAESSVLVVVRVHPACAQLVYTAMTPDFNYLYNLTDIQMKQNAITNSSESGSLVKIEENHEEQGTCSLPVDSPPHGAVSMTKDDNQTGNSAMGTGFGDAQYLARESQTEDASSMPVYAPRGVPVIMTEEDDDETGDSGMGTGSGGVQFFMKEPPSASGYTALKLMEVRVNQYANRTLSTSNTNTRQPQQITREPQQKTREPQQITREPQQKTREPQQITRESQQLNRSVLLEVIRVLESPKVQEMELAQKVRAMISGSTLPLPTLEIHRPHSSGDGKYIISDMDRDSAERLLRHEDCEDGMFIVRDGSNAKCEYVLSVKFEQEVYHILIYKDKSLRYFTLGSPRFYTLEELIDECQKHQLFVVS